MEFIVLFLVFQHVATDMESLGSLILFTDLRTVGLQSVLRDARNPKKCMFVFVETA